MSSITAQLKVKAHSLGFHLAAACPAVSPEGYHRLLDWIDHGYAGEMSYMDARRAAYQHPNGVMPGTQSLLVLGFPYRSDDPIPESPSGLSGRIARYSWGSVDYHDVIHQRLKQLAEMARQQVPGSTVRGVVDTAPLLEREFGVLSGLGWIGRNTMLINTMEGSYFFLAALLVSFPLDYDQPMTSTHCGTCTACIDVCPTDALLTSGEMDARKCISYLTIEHRGPIDFELRPLMGNWLFGCDECQDVCPWNRRGSIASEPEFKPQENRNPCELSPLFSLDDEQFRSLFRKSPLWRARRRGILRNAAIVLGNTGSTDAVEPLIKGTQDPEALVRGASAWGLGQIGSTTGIEALKRLEQSETDSYVREEITQALCKGSESK